MTPPEFLQFGEQIAKLHRCRIEDAPGSGGSSPLRRGQATVERLPDHGGDRSTALPRQSAHPLVALIVDENLQPMRQHTHTLACACGPVWAHLCGLAPSRALFHRLAPSWQPIRSRLGRAAASELVRFRRNVLHDLGDVWPYGHRISEPNR